MAKTSMRAVSVTVAPSGGWAVKDTATSATVVHETQAEAIAVARASIARSGGQILVQGRDGRTKKNFTLGRAAMEALNAVEGLALSGRMRRVLETSGQTELDYQARRASLRATATGKTKT